MEPGFLKIFRRIINELALLHQNNKFHGNFRNNVKVITTYSTPHLIRGSRTVSLGERKPLPDSLDEIRDGIMSDIEALQSMVKEVVTITKFRNPTQIGLIWDLFCNEKIYMPTQCMTLHQVKKCALYNFSSPIFFRQEGSVQFDFQAPWDKEEELENVWNTLWNWKLHNSICRDWITVSYNGIWNPCWKRIKCPIRYIITITPLDSLCDRHVHTVGIGLHSNGLGRPEGGLWIFLLPPSITSRPIWMESYPYRMCMRVA